MGGVGAGKLCKSASIVSVLPALVRSELTPTLVHMCCRAPEAMRWDCSRRAIASSMFSWWANSGTVVFQRRLRASVARGHAAAAETSAAPLANSGGSGSMVMCSCCMLS